MKEQNLIEQVNAISAAIRTPGFPTSAYVEFSLHRHESRSPMSFQGHMSMIRRINAFREQGLDVESMLHRAIECGWMSIYEEREIRKPQASAAQLVL